MTRVGAAAACCVLLSLRLAAQPPRTSTPIGQERAIPRHLRDSDVSTLPLPELIRFGERLFAANWTEQDGAGRPASQGSGRPLGDPRLPLTGGRATNRASGPDANSCQGCHNLPFGITGGGGDFVAVGFDGADRFDFVTFDRRETERKPGRAPKQPDSLQAFGLRASPGLFGAGYLEMLARQMTEDLQQVRDGLKPGSTAPLGAKGVTFGFLSRRADGGWDVSRVEGLAAESTRTERGGAPSLLVRPWYQTGRAVSLREFTNDALNRHHGIQSVERFGENTDPDGDGVVDEATRADLTALVLFQATRPVPGRVIASDPVIEHAVAEGEQRFTAIGCARCHAPSLPLDREGWLYAEPNPFNPPGTLRRADGRSLRVNLAADFLPPPAASSATRAGGVMNVPAYTDLKLHQVSSDPGSPRFLTRRLWGSANEPPYWHDGSCTTLRDAVLAHGGEALESRRAFEVLPPAGRDALIEFLKTFQVLPPGTEGLVVDERFRERAWPR